jgi:opacity protein-like surface antigen
MFRNTIFTSFLAAAALAAPALAQTESGRQEVSVQAFGSFVSTTTHNGVDNSATNSGGVLASYRFFFTKHQGVEGNYGYALNTQNYASAAGLTGINTNTHEISGAYVYRLPLGKVKPFALAGAGALVFDPKNFAGISSQTRASFIYGVGADIDFTSHLFLRAEYRGFVYNSPTYALTALDGLDRTTHRAEPSIGFGYRF